MVHLNRKLVLTNYHVVGDESEVAVLFPCYEKGKLVVERDFYQRRYKQQVYVRGKVVKLAKGQDLALVELEKVPGGALPLLLAAHSASPGEMVHSIGNPGASDAMWLYTSGSVRQVSHKTWQGGNFLRSFAFDAQVVETQSPTNPGDSGGPLVNAAVELVGVTQGMRVNARQLSYFIDVTEVSKLLAAYRVPPREVVGTGTPPPESPGVIEDPSRPGSVPEPSPELIDLVKGLDHPDAKVRAGSARKLGELGEDAWPALGALVKTLGDPDEIVRRRAAEALGKIGMHPQHDVPVLAAALKDERLAVRLYATEALGKLGPDAKGAASALAASLKDRNAEVRRGSAAGLGKIGPAAKEVAYERLVEALADPDADVRTAARDALRDLGALGIKAARTLLALLRDSRAPAEARAYAADALGQIGPDVRGEALADLIKSLKDKEGAVRAAARKALKQVGPPGRADAPVLLDALKDKGSIDSIRRFAIESLGNIGRAIRRAALPDLLSALEDEDAAVSAAASKALVDIGPPSKEDVPRLVAAATKPGGSAALKRYAITSFGEMGADAKSAGSCLARLLLQESDKDTRVRAAEALEQVSPDAADVVSNLERALKQHHQEKGLCLSVTRTLSKIKPEEAALPGLLQAVDNEDKEVKGLAEQALAQRANSLTKDQVPDLRDALKRKGPAARLYAAKVLAGLRSGAADATPELQTALMDKDPEIRIQAIRTLESIGPPAKKAGADLTKLLSDHDRKLRVHAALALVAIDREVQADGKAALKTLILALRPESTDDLKNEEAKALAGAAAKALARVGKPAVEPLVDAIQTHFRGGNKFTGENIGNGLARLAAIKILEKIGPKAKSPRVMFMLAELQGSDPVPVVRGAAKQARAALQAKE